MIRDIDERRGDLPLAAGEEEAHKRDTHGEHEAQQRGDKPFGGPHETFVNRGAWSMGATFRRSRGRPAPQ